MTHTTAAQEVARLELEKQTADLRAHVARLNAGEIEETEIERIERMFRYVRERSAIVERMRRAA